MYLIDFFKKLFKSKNIGIIIWLIFNILIFIFPFISISPNYPILGLLCGIAVYVVTISIVLSPVGEWFFRLINGCKKIIDSSIINRLTPLFKEVYARAKINYPNLSPNIKLYMINDHYPNSFALRINTVCVTRGHQHFDDEKRLFVKSGGGKSSITLRISKLNKFFRLLNFHSIHIIELIKRTISHL